MKDTVQSWDKRQSIVYTVIYQKLAKRQERRQKLSVLFPAKS